MGFFYTTQLRTRLDAGADLNGKVLKVTLLARAPQLDSDDDRAVLRGATTLTSLLNIDGWEEVSTAGYARATTTPVLITSGSNRYLKLNTSLVAFPGAMLPSVVQAVVFSVTGTDIGLPAGDYVLFGTTTPFTDKTVFQGGDGISARIDTSIGERWLFGYAISGGITTAIVDGTIVIQQGAPPFETSHVHHAWMIPQRINYIANPSWEVGATHWQTNVGAMTRVSAPSAFPSAWLGHATGVVPSGPLPRYDPTMRLYIKSNSFYPRSQDFTFQIMARGTGIARVGLVYHPRDYSEYASDWGLLPTLGFQEWTLNSDTFVHMTGVRSMSDGYEAALMIEVRPDDDFAPEVFLDLGLVEEGILLDWEYFDGDSTYGGTDDFSWYGNVALAAKRGKSFSLWYNNRRSIAGRLFGRLLDDTAYYTSTDEQLDSLVSQWVPAGSVVAPHWNVLGEADMQVVPVDRSATTLPVSIWPELAQPFRSLSQVSLSPTSSVITVVGEGAYPVTGGWILSGTTAYPITIAPRVTTDLFDLSAPQTLEISWPSVPAFDTHTLYLQRGGLENSPLSWLIVTPSANVGSAVIAGATGLAMTPSVAAMASGNTSIATGVASNVPMNAGMGAITAGATGVGNTAASVPVTTGGAVTGVATGVGYQAAVV